MKWIQYISVWLLFFLLNYSVAAPASRFQRYLDQWRKENGVTSVVVRIDDITKNTVKSYVSGTITRQEKKPVNVNTLYGIGSISKTFVSAALLQLQEAGAVNLDQPIGKYFPQYPRWKNITIRELLNMTSGMVNYTRLPAYWHLADRAQKTRINPKQLIDMAYQKPDYFSPGTAWRYSNTNYLLAGQIIEKVTHQPLSLFYETHFFEPLHLKQSYFSDYFYPKTVTEKMAHGYLGEKDMVHFNPGLTGAAGAMVMSSQDLLRWVRALLVSKTILSLKSQAQLEKTINMPFKPPKPKGSRYGLGIYSWTLPAMGKVWWYVGVINGYSSAFVYIPQKHKIIVVQIATWPIKNYAILFLTQPLMQHLLAM